MRSTRRQFVGAAGGLLIAPALARSRELACDIAVIGGGTGGCAAALAAARNGMRVILTEETGWIGGQLTSQAVPPARAVQLKMEPRRIRNNEKLRREFQEWIQAQGVEIAWPTLTPR